MNSVFSTIFVLVLALGLCNALTCYSCSGPACATRPSGSTVCGTDLPRVCTTYSFVQNGQLNTVRSCDPAYLGGFVAPEYEFCTRTRATFAAVAVRDFSCHTCSTDRCNV